jgi:hypothetical protein
MTYQRNRVEWSEGTFLLIAEQHGKKLELWERESFEVRWYPIHPTAARLAKARRLLKLGNIKR